MKSLYSKFDNYEWRRWTSIPREPFVTLIRYSFKSYSYYNFFLWEYILWIMAIVFVEIVCYHISIPIMGFITFLFLILIGKELDEHTVYFNGNTL